jgi:hypothetical protein
VETTDIEVSRSIASLAENARTPCKLSSLTSRAPSA